MTDLITGVSGRTGAVAGDMLLEQKQDIRVMVRKEADAEAWRAKGAEVVIGDFTDQDSLTAAMEGIEGAYLMTPPLAEAENLLEERIAIEEHMIAAMKANDVKHAVLLSAFAAHLAEGTGQIVGLHRMENRFKEAGLSFTSLRAAFFMENWMPSVAGAKASGNFASFVHPTSLKIEQVSTKDIGAAIVRALSEGHDGQRYISVAGPERYSADDGAAALAAHMSQEISPVELGREKWHGVWGGLGWSEDRCRLYEEFFMSINSGLAVFSDEDEIWRGKDSLDDVIKRLAG